MTAIDELWTGLRLLLLLGVANGAPILAHRLLGARGGAPLDAGLRFVDGRPLLGPSKTVRGVLAAVIATAAAAMLLGWTAATGAVLGAAAMAGDALSSFVKRRLGIAPSGRAAGIDQVPESLLPLLAVRAALGLAWWQVAAVTVAFLVLEVPLSRWLYRLHVRDRPY
jgi:CDP-2,3-bis-(O-geranylgeranyl)-sn-glycerol synthase